MITNENINQIKRDLKRIAKENNIIFEMVMNNITALLHPIYRSILNESEFFGDWDNVEKK